MSNIKSFVLCNILYSSLYFFSDEMTFNPLYFFSDEACYIPLYFSSQASTSRSLYSKGPGPPL